MKHWIKKTSIFYILFFMTISLFGQRSYDAAIGVRAGNLSGLEGRFYFSEHSSAEGIIGWDFERGGNLTGLYEYGIYISEVADVYGGGGISMAYNKLHKFTFGFEAVIGGQITMPMIPVNFGVDWKPNWVFDKDLKLGLLNFGLTIRYVFR